MTTSNSIADGTVVTIHYTLRDDGGDVIDTSDGREPLAYLHGASNIVPGLERELTGKAAGDEVSVAVPPAEGYGDRTGVSDKVPLEAFGEEAKVQAGDRVMARDDGGKVFPLWVTEVDDGHAVVTPDHPLAGTTLHFTVAVQSVRSATAEELEHGHPHGPGGHGH